MRKDFEWRKYVLVFLITAGIFLIAMLLSNYFGERKVEQLKTLQNQIALDILSSETQFALLQDLSCKNISGTVLSEELGDLGRKIEWGEGNLGNQSEVEYLKKYYSLLQIKDYLLSRALSARCDIKLAFILYFYTALEHCSECEKQSIVLSTLRSRYPELRVYSFDYSMPLSAVESMISIYGVEDTKLPALVIDGDLYTGFQSLDVLEKRILESFELAQEPEPVPESEE